MYYSNLWESFKFEESQQFSNSKSSVNLFQIGWFFKSALFVIVKLQQTVDKTEIFKTAQQKRDYFFKSHI